MKFYVYCVVEKVPKVEQPIVGLEQNDVEWLVMEDFAVAASKFESDVVQVTRENVLRHEAVVRKAFDEATVIPFRFGTLVTEAGLKGFLRARRNALAERLVILKDCVEMSVKIIWQNWPEEEQVRKAETELEAEVSSGTAFLVSKRKALRGDEKLDLEAREIASWLSSGLRGVVRQEQVTIEPQKKLFLAASYLVERPRALAYRETLLKLRAERPALHFLTSGPWPPYSFANIDLEFETHFGVS